MLPSMVVRGFSGESAFVSQIKDASERFQKVYKPQQNKPQYIYRPNKLWKPLGTKSVRERIVDVWRTWLKRMKSVASMCSGK
jgi:hypothetical protein